MVRTVSAALTVWPCLAASQHYWCRRRRRLVEAERCILVSVYHWEKKAAVKCQKYLGRKDFLYHLLLQLRYKKTETHNVQTYIFSNVNRNLWSLFKLIIVLLVWYWKGGNSLCCWDILCLSRSNLKDSFLSGVDYLLDIYELNDTIGAYERAAIILWNDCSKLCHFKESQQKERLSERFWGRWTSEYNNSVYHNLDYVDNIWCSEAETQISIKIMRCTRLLQINDQMNWQLISMYFM